MFKKLLVDQEVVLTTLGLPAEAESGLGALAQLMEASEWPSAEAAIYALATVHHETGGIFQPVLQSGEPEDFGEWEPDTPYGSLLGNRWEGDGYLFRRRGYMPIAGRHLYSTFSSVLRLPLITEPDQVLEPSVAFLVLQQGMIGGFFTGRKITHFISDSLANYVEARRVFNRLDKANVIANYARAIEERGGVAVAEEHQQ